MGLYGRRASLAVSVNLRVVSPSFNLHKYFLALSAAGLRSSGTRVNPVAAVYNAGAGQAPSWTSCNRNFASQRHRYSHIHHPSVALLRLLPRGLVSASASHVACSPSMSKTPSRVWRFGIPACIGLLLLAWPYLVPYGHRDLAGAVWKNEAASPLMQNKYRCV